MAEGLDIQLHGFEITLLPGKAVYLHQFRLLAFADPHLGKDATFRAGGIPIPTGATESTIRSMDRVIDVVDPAHVVILGDMFHDGHSLTETVKQLLIDWRSRHEHRRFDLVLGNHDRHLATRLGELPFAVHAHLKLGRLGLAHDPSEWLSDIDLLLCGHVHPSFRTSTRTDSLGSLPCFFASRKRFVLPAIGEFTGTHAVSPKAGDEVWLIADDRVVPAFQKSLRC